MVEEILKLVNKVADWLDQGVSREDIAKRLADPTNVGADLLRRAAKRRSLGRRLLGRDYRK